MKPLGWLIVILSASTIGSFASEAPVWIGSMFAVLSCLAVILYFVAYIYFGITDKDALRSEKFSIQKMAIQNGFVGDDSTGYIPIVTRNVTPSAKVLPTNEEASEQA